MAEDIINCESNDTSKIAIYAWLYDTLYFKYVPADSETLSSNEEKHNFVSGMLTNAIATNFLLVWPIMEQKLFDGFLTKGQLEPKAAEWASSFPGLNMEQATRHFHNRYQDAEKYELLRKNPKSKNADKVEKCQHMNDILEKSYTELANEEKLFILLYVTYRFRNNIFHGNKIIDNWAESEAEINYCIQFMMNIVSACAHLNSNQ